MQLPPTITIRLFLHRQVLSSSECTNHYGLFTICFAATMIARTTAHRARTHSHQHTLPSFYSVLHHNRHPPPHASYFTLCSTRSEEHTSELKSLMRISYAVFCLKKKIQNQHSRNP